MAVADDRSLLIFSGGSTRPSTPTPESHSYLFLARALSLLSTPSSVPADNFDSLSHRTTTEDHALDSYQNVLFALARFRAFTGRYPTRMTVVGFEMKRKRFEELHLRAVRWPSVQDHWSYVGIDMEDVRGSLEEAERGEVLNGLTPYTHDLYGCHGPLLSKRRARNAAHRQTHGYHASAPELSGLLEWCPGPDSGRSSRDRAAVGDDWGSDAAFGADHFTGVFPGALPWDHLGG